MTPDESTMRLTNLFVGTSGWHYKHWLGQYYPAKFPSTRMLDWYSREFRTVEINNSFYRLPSESALLSWREGTPEGFCFAVKASRFITHMKRLTDPQNAIENFFSRTRTLDSKLGPILFQLPPRWNVNTGRLEAFLSALPRSCRYAVELRDLSWCNANVYRILERYRVALCVHDWHGVSWPKELTTDFTYIRLHGPTGVYSGDYPPSVLASWADQITKWRELVNRIYVYFNNDQGGFAITNARSLTLMLAGTIRSNVA